MPVSLPKEQDYHLHRQPTSTAVEECMLICHHNADLQTNTDSHKDVDWTQSAQAYPNLEELPTFITQQRQSAAEHSFTTTADPQHLQGKQPLAYTLVQEHAEAEVLPPLRMIVSGTAGTGKSYLIHCLRLLLGNRVRVTAPTSVAAFNIEGHTLHSLLSLPVKGDFKDLEGERLHDMQQSLVNMEYLIIDEMSMVGMKTLGQADKRLRQVFPHHADTLLGGCSCLLFGDFGQLPPVMDLPLYTTVPRSTLSDLGSTAYQLFYHAVVLKQVMRQSGQSSSQVLFRHILLRLRDAQLTESDWKQLMKQTPAQVQDVAPFSTALHLHPTVEALVEHNVARLHGSGQPIATIKAIHTGPNAAKASSEDTDGLEPIIFLACGARVMLTANLWVDVGLVNGAMGTVAAICYSNGGAPPHLPVAVMVHFDAYQGPKLPDGTVPITPLHCTWSASGASFSRLQLPLKLAWAITIHKAQGLTLDKVFINVGKKEFSTGLTFVACSRVRCLNDLLFDPPFPFQRVSNFAKSHCLHERLLEDTRLLLLEARTLTHLPPTASPSCSLNHSPPSMNSLTPSSPTITSLSIRSPSPTSSFNVLSTHSPPFTELPTPDPPFTELPTSSPPFTELPTPSPPFMDYLTPSLPFADLPTPSPPCIGSLTPSPLFTDSPTPSPPFMQWLTPALPL